MANLEDSSDSTLLPEDGATEHQIQPAPDTEAIDETRHSLFTRLSAGAVIAGISLTAADNALASIPESSDNPQDGKHVYQMPTSEMPDYSKAMKVAANDKKEIEKNVIDGERFIKAAETGDIETVKVFLDKGVMVNYANSRQWTALLSATREGHLEIVQLLLKHGADTKSINNALRFAIQRGHLEIAKLLLENGVDAEGVNRGLELAAKHGCLEIVKLFLNSGVEIDNNNHALVLAFLKIDDVERNIRANANNQDYLTVLKSLLKDANAIIQLLIEAGININARDDRGRSALAIATAQDNIKMVQQLIDMGADVSSGEEMALLAAARTGNVDVVKLLLANNADVNVKSDWKRTALMTASKKGHIEIVRLLVAAGADLDCKEDGWRDMTALHYAIKEGHTEIALFLIERGADITSKDHHETTALEYAFKYKHFDVAKALFEKSMELDIDSLRQSEILLSLAFACGRTDVVKRFIEEGEDVKAKIMGEGTYLMMASVGNNWVDEVSNDSLSEEERKKLLIFIPSDINSYLDIIRMLLKEGVDINAVDENGETALMIAIRAGADIEIVRLLVESKADLNLKNKRGETALSLAIKKGHNEIVQLLRDNGAK
jgi:ankyrin repeat protein